MKNKSEIRSRLIHLYGEQKKWDSYDRGLEIKALEWILEVGDKK